MVLAGTLDQDRYEIHLASDPRYEAMARSVEGVTWHPLPSISPQDWLAVVETPGQTYSDETIAQYQENEIRLYDEVKPDFIVVDTRWTVSTSAEYRRIPYAQLVNAQWSPYAEHNIYEPIDNPVRLFARRARQKLRAVKRTLLGQPPPLDDLDAIAFNKGRKRYGLKPLHDFYQFACRGDWVLYAEAPGIFPIRPLPPTHIFIGPVLWSPDVKLPDWWGKWDPDKPIVYLTPGSTGQAASLPDMVREIASLPVTVLVATAGRVNLGETPPNVLAADYLPGIECARLASLVVFNGGSATGFQAMSAGTPVLGVWTNPDQKISMMLLEQAGAGLSAEAVRASATEIRVLAERVLTEPSFKARAEEIAARFAAYDAKANFASFIDRVTGSRPAAAA
jgi:UDP:flavonoid glycosyltransferase YjiC (YdhE family)